MRPSTILGCLALLFVAATPALVAAAPCTSAERGRILAPGTGEIEVRCDLELQRDQVVEKTIVLLGPEASGVQIDCNGARLTGGRTHSRKSSVEIRSRPPSGDRTDLSQWRRPENIEIRDCRLEGNVRIISMANGGSDADARPSSRRAGHAARARAAAPRNITLRDLTIDGQGWTPLYISQGATQVRLLDSEILGLAESVAIYLDAESGNNEIRGNTIHPRTTKRELIAIDGSSDNLIVNNQFSSLNHGGIYLYRNCGERGTVRHTTPTRNLILNNVFYYNKYGGSKPAVYLGSRDGSASAGYCNEDRGANLGSSADDRDFARYNVVMGNQIYKFRMRDMVRSKNESLNSPNFVNHNQTITRPVERRSGCYVPGSFKREFIAHGESVEALTGANECRVQRCDDGVLSQAGSCSVVSASFECSRSGSNDGCSTAVTCPGESGEIIGVTAACNLEGTDVSAAQVRGSRPNTLSVVRPSDRVEDGVCRVGNTEAQQRWSPVHGSPNQRQTTARCREHDKNGGDCKIAGTVYCKAPPPVVHDLVRPLPRDPRRGPQLPKGRIPRF